MKYFLLTCTLAQMISAASQTETDDTNVISFANPETEAAVRDRLVRTYKLVELADESVPITVGQAAKIEDLHLNIQGGADPLDGLEKLSNLNWLILTVNGRTEALAELGKLSDLTSLSIHCHIETDVVIPEGLDNLEFLAIYTNPESPAPISLRVESSLPSLVYLQIDYALESVYLNAEAMPALEDLYVNDFGQLRGHPRMFMNSRLRTLDVVNTFPPVTRIHVHDSEFMENYESLMKACRNVTGFHLQYLKNHKENPATMETTYDLDFREFSNLSSLSVSSRRVAKLYLPEHTDSLSILNLYYISDLSINLSDMENVKRMQLGYSSNISIIAPDSRSRLEWLRVYESQLNEIFIDPQNKSLKFNIYNSKVGKLVMSMLPEFRQNDLQVEEYQITPRLTITDTSVSYSSLGGHHQLLESQDMISWKPIHTSPDYTGELHRYTYRKGIPKEAPQTFYKIVKVNP